MELLATLRYKNRYSLTSSFSVHTIARCAVWEVYSFHEEIRETSSTIAASIKRRYDDVEYRCYEPHWKSDEKKNYQPNNTPYETTQCVHNLCHSVLSWVGLKTIAVKVTNMSNEHKNNNLGGSKERNRLQQRGYFVSSRNA